MGTWTDFDELIKFINLWFSFDEMKSNTLAVNGANIEPAGVERGKVFWKPSVRQYCERGLELLLDETNIAFISEIHRYTRL